MATEFLANLGNLILNTEHPAVLLGGFSTGLGAVLAIDQNWRTTGLRMAFIGTLAGVSPYLIFNIFIQPSFPQTPLLAGRFAEFLGAVAAGGLLAILWQRYAQPLINRSAKALTVASVLARNQKTDVRKIDQFLPQVPSAFDPLEFWNATKGFFLGLDERANPIFWRGDMPHLQVAGTSGSGKGVILSMLAGLCTAVGEAVFYLDPKNDEWAPHVLAWVAKQTKKPFHLVDLRPTADFQINLLAGATEEEITELFFAGFGLSEKGTDADFYRIADRKAAKKMAKLAASGELTAAALHNAYGSDLAETAPAFAGYLQEMAELRSVNAKSGLDLETIIADGGAVYVIGSMRNAAVVRMQRMLLVRLIQLAERRDRNKGTPKKICIVLDELKYHISRPALEAMGAARDKGVHLILAHQSLADLRDCPADLDPEAVVGAVMENCKLKLVYRLEDPDTAEWLARKSGRIQVDDEMRKVMRNVGMAETVLGERSIRQAERFLIDENMILNLRFSQGVLFGNGLPKFIHTSPVRVDKVDLLPESWPGDAVQDAENLISIPAAPAAGTSNKKFKGLI